MLLKNCLFNRVIFFSILMVFSINASAKNGIYLTVEGGLGIQSGLPRAKEINDHYTDKHTYPSAYRIAIGYNHDLFPCFGIGFDVGKSYYGEKTYVYASDKTHVRSRTLEFLALLQWHIRQWDLISKIGGLRHTVVITGRDAQDDKTVISSVVSIGIAYNFTSNFAILVSHARVSRGQIYSFHKTNKKRPRLSETLLGFRYTFG
jgi:Outer membrane protein beta-barrel domain